jgi:nucleoside-diphosphate-sugar epimerase
MLAARGEQVLVVARASSRLSHLDTLTSGEAPSVRVLRTELVPGDPTLAGAVRGVRTIYHCAGCSTDWASPAAYRQGNVISTEAMLAAARSADQLQHFVHVSTTDVYGYPKLPCHEESRLYDTGLLYNKTKILGEQAVWRVIAEGLPVTIVRPASIYGPRGTAFVTDIARLLKERTMAYVDRGRAPGGFVYVDDVAEAMIAAAANPATVGEAYNLSSIHQESWRRYCSYLADALGLKKPWLDLPFSFAMGLAAAMEAPQRYLRMPGRPLLTRHAVYLLARNQEYPSLKARDAFGWQPAVSLEEGIARSVAWLREMHP